MIRALPLFLYRAVSILMVLFSFELAVAAGPQEKTIDIKPLTPVKKVMPLYPQNLKEEGVAGEVAFAAVISASGEVKAPIIVRRLHPELDRLAQEAVSRWRFNPFVLDGEAVDAPTFISIVFSPDPVSAEPSAAGPQNEAEDAVPGVTLPDDLRSLLDRSAAYAARLSEAALFYACRERIERSVRGLDKEAILFRYSIEGFGLAASYEYPILKGSKKTAVENDYQLVRERERVVAGRKPSDGNKEGLPPDANQVPGVQSLMPTTPAMLVPAGILDPEVRSSFSWKSEGEERINGRTAVVIALRSRSRKRNDLVGARLWLEKPQGRVLAIEMKTRTLPGAEPISRECAPAWVTPHFTTRHFYGVAKKGLFYPSRSEIRVEYTGLGGPGAGTKAAVDFRYDRYRFFTVETDYRTGAGTR